MKGLLIDYPGVFAAGQEDHRRWLNFIQAARQRGIKVACYSNEADALSADKIRELEYHGTVDAVVLACDTGVKIPESQAFELTAAALDLDKKDCVVVDPHIMTIRAAADDGLVGVFYQQFDRAIVEVSVLLDIKGDF